ncbi:MAG: phytanoyl-CoA dioxygenase family protein [Gammaproteobacteria bacterium]
MPSELALNDEQVDAFHRAGYVIARGMFDDREAQLLLETARRDAGIAGNAMDLPDGGGGISKITVWNHPGDDIYGMVARSERVVESMTRLLEDEVYHYHSKLMIKEPQVGGAWLWHQDYGYWYQNGCLYPLLTSCFIALDHASRRNGALEVLEGSHALGRLEHAVVGGQLQADPEHVNEAMQRHRRVYVEMAPGDGAFFHCNLLHCSGPNRSPDPRWTLICCYNARRNDPYKPSQHPAYTPLTSVADAMVRAYGLRTSTADQVFMQVDDDLSKERRALRRAVHDARGS